MTTHSTVLMLAEDVVVRAQAYLSQRDQSLAAMRQQYIENELSSDRTIRRTFLGRLFTKQRTVEQIAYEYETQMFHPCLTGGHWVQAIRTLRDAAVRNPGTTLQVDVEIAEML